MIIKREVFVDALMKCDSEMVGGMLDSGMEATARIHDYDDERAIHLAAAKCTPEIIDLLIERGADPGYIEKNGGHTPLHHACQNGRLENAAALVAHNVKLDVQGRSGLSPLHLAAANGHSEICRMLIQSGARTDLKDIAGLTPLEYARKHKHPKAAQAILEAISLRNSQRIKTIRTGRTPARRPAA